MKVGDIITDIFGDKCLVTHIFSYDCIEVKRMKDKCYMLYGRHYINEDLE